MKQQLNTGADGVTYGAIPLRNLVNQLVSDSLATAVQQKSIIVNEVPTGLFITADENQLNSVIGELLATMVANSNRGRIFINAERFGDMIILHLQDRNNYNGYALAYKIKSMEPMATMLGGYITMEGETKLETTISFGFPFAKKTLPQYNC